LLFACFDAVVRAVDRISFALIDLVNKWIADYSARKSHRAFNYHHIFLFGIDIRLFECRVRIAFMGGHKAGPHLHTGRAQIQESADIIAYLESRFSGQPAS